MMAGVLPATLRLLLRNVQIRSRRICPAPESAHRQTTDITKVKGPVFRLGLLLYLMPGDSLLSHGETPREFINASCVFFGKLNVI